jgi:hypothetical protein
MDIGAAIFFTEYSISPAELAVALEERGFDSLWVAEHSHIPVTRRFTLPGAMELTKQYYDVMDPFVTLTAAAVVTRRLKLATAISYLEKAFSGNQEPATVATSVRPFLAEEIMQSIQSVGIDVFFAKVAKLPSASPLSSQAGKNWVRKVGKALVGE